MMERTQLKILKDKLKEMKVLINEDLNTFDFKDIYDTIYEACRDYECNTGDCRMIDKIKESPILDTDDLSYYFHRIDNIPIMRDFLISSRQADIYKLNKCGNLENVTSKDMLELCDGLLDLINQRLKIQKEEMC